MDSGWAVVVGAAIALIGSTFGPWLLAKHDRKQQQREQQRAALQAAIVDTTDGLGRMLLHRFHDGKPGAFSDIINATTRLGLLLDAKDSPIEDLAVTTLTIVQSAPTVEEAGLALSVYQTVTHEWFRRQIPGHQVLDRARQESAKQQTQPLNTSQPRHADD